MVALRIRKWSSNVCMSPCVEKRHNRNVPGVNSAELWREIFFFFWSILFFIVQILSMTIHYAYQERQKNITAKILILIATVY